jgi:hypothetical protein
VVAVKIIASHFFSIDFNSDSQMWHSTLSRMHVAVRLQKLASLEVLL